MKLKNTLIAGIVLFCLLSVNNAIGQTLVENLKILSNEASIEFSNEITESYLVEIGGPDQYYFRQEVEQKSDITIANQKANGEKFADGVYTLQVTPILKMNDAQRSELIKLRAAGDQEAIAAFRKTNKLPTNVDTYVVNFSILNGKFVSRHNNEEGNKIPTMSSQWQQDHPALYASVNTQVKNLPSYTTDNSLAGMEDAQVFATDLIVQGSACVGFDCVSSESFGFDTHRLKENNLRIHFDDTSASASFPSNDWRIAANDTSNGGDNFLAIQDATAGTTPFKVEAGAGNNALHVDASGGNVGMGTATPIVELHVTDGDSPTMRLEQNGSNGWTPQTWDIAGNETNFFVRDVTNGSKLPFKIRPGAPDNSIYIDPEGDIGLGTASPGDNALQVESGDVLIKNGDLTLDNGKIKMTGNLKITGNSVVDGDAIFRSAGGATRFTVDEATGFVSIGAVATPAHLLELATDDAAKPNGGMWTATSDRRLKKNIKDFTVGLDAVLKIRPVTYNYNSKSGYSSEKQHVGVIAQDMKEIAPFTVGLLKKEAPKGEAPYLSYDGTPVTYMLINAVQEQQTIIDSQKEEIETLKNQLAQMQSLKQDMAALTQMVEGLAASNNNEEEASTTGEEKE